MLELVTRLLVPDRTETDELLDAHDAPADDVERSLCDLRRINRFLGGHRAWRWCVRALGDLVPGDSILEIGTGSSDLLESTEDRVIRVGLDNKIDHLAYGRRIGERSIQRVVGDARQLPFRDRSFSMVGSSHFFHHFSLRENAAILEECLRVARDGAFATDTTRNRLPLLFVRLLGLLRLVGRITRFDAPASVLQGYTPQEVRSIAGRFNRHRVIIRRLIPFRFALIIGKEPENG